MAICFHHLFLKGHKKRKTRVHIQNLFILINQLVEYSFSINGATRMIELLHYFQDQFATRSSLVTKYVGMSLLNTFHCIFFIDKRSQETYIQA